MAGPTMSVSAKFAAARLYLTERVPYFSAAVFGLMPMEVPRGALLGPGAPPTIGVTKNAILLYEKEAIDAWTVQDLATGLVHEIMHLLRDHAGRRGDRDPRTWNHAGDAEINDDIEAMQGLLLLPTDITPATLAKELGVPVAANGLAESYYDLLKKQQQKKQAGGSGQGKPGRGACGGCAGNPTKHDKDKDGGGGAGDKDGDGSQGAGNGGRSELEMSVIRNGVASAIEEHVQSKGQGSVPLGLQRWAKQQLKPPVVRWEDKLGRISRSAIAWAAGAVDFTYARPSRRQAGVGYGSGKPIMHALIAPIPEVVFVLDTSGSMGDEEIIDGLSEVASIFAKIKARVQFIASDAGVHSVVTCKTMKELQKHIKGGGGTDFRPALELCEQMKPRPKVVIYCTDGDGAYPTHAPKGMKVIWLIVGSYTRRPPWGDVINIPRKGKQEVV